jgi:hypothetical protein
VRRIPGLQAQSLGTLTFRSTNPLGIFMSGDGEGIATYVLLALGLDYLRQRFEDQPLELETNGGWS